MVVEPRICEPLAGADFTLGYKGNSSSEKGQTTTEVFLSQNRVSLDFWNPKSLSLKKLPLGLSRCCWAQPWAQAIWEATGTQNRHGETSLSHCRQR